MSINPNYRGLDMDDHLATTKSDSSGHFELHGSEDEISDIDPKLNIYHDCEDGVKPCQRKLVVEIPDKYISSGKTPKRFYDAGTIELLVIYIINNKTMHII